MQLIALDLGTRMGFACGKAGHGAIPRSGAMILREGPEPTARAYSNLQRWLCGIIEAVPKPERRSMIVVKEAALSLAAFKILGNAAATVEFTYKLHGAVESVCDSYRILCRDVADSTVRKHFIGKANAGKRTATKAAVLHRAKLLKYISDKCTDDNRADACAVFDYAAHTFARASGGVLLLFGDAA